MIKQGLTKHNVNKINFKMIMRSKIHKPELRMLSTLAGAEAFPLPDSHDKKEERRS